MASVAPDEFAHLDNEGFVEAAKHLIVGAINGAVALAKGWKEERPGVVAAIKEDFRTAWGVFEPTRTESPLPIAAVAGVVGVFTILGILITSMAGLFSLLGSLIGLVGTLATAGTYVYFLRRRIGQPITPIDATKAVVGDWKAFVITMLTCAGVFIPASFALLIPGLMLAAFIIPTYYVEDLRGLAAARRSLWLFKQDGRRILLSLLALGSVYAMVMIVLPIVFGILGSIGGILGVIISAAIQGVLGAFAAAFVLEIYFDVRAHCDNGDAEQDARNHLGDG